MERGVRLNGEDYCYYYSSGDGGVGVASSSTASPLPRVGGAAAAAACDGTVGGGGMNYIEHHVTKFDTLAGVAIRYGVEVADVKRINGLITDLQMFARKTLKIPLPGRHPPSPCLSNGFDVQGDSISERTPPNRRHSDLFDTFQSLKLKPPPTQRKVSSAMSSLRGYYGLEPSSDQKAASEGVEMARYEKGRSPYLDDNDPPSPISNPALGLHRKCKSVANGFMTENGQLVDHESNQETKDSGSNRLCDKSFRRRQKSETDFSRTQEMLMKEDNSSSGGFTGITPSKGLALRPNPASRTASLANGESSLINPIPFVLGDSPIADISSLDRVRKSSSASNLQDSDSSSSSSTLASLWPTSKWSLTDFQALSTSAITRSIFDGLPKPISGRRNKAALD
ncbi:unnamed protein product [Cuscuta campestris]|uniref:LysM domain-containing protein n=1 Tax=Cuscuta campestris TaxID=132261 RepID=A0A484KM17_9ASTE|nr:unnamed protein product [Cuscuta campestris]